MPNPKIQWESLAKEKNEYSNLLGAQSQYSESARSRARDGSSSWHRESRPTG